MYICIVCRISHSITSSEITSTVSFSFNPLSPALYVVLLSREEKKKKKKKKKKGGIIIHAQKRS